MEMVSYTTLLPIAPGSLTLTSCGTPGVTVMGAWVAAESNPLPHSPRSCLPFRPLQVRVWVVEVERGESARAQLPRRPGFLLQELIRSRALERGFLRRCCRSG